MNIPRLIEQQIETQLGKQKVILLYGTPYEGFWTDAKGARGTGYKAFQNGMYGYGMTLMVYGMIYTQKIR